MRAEAEAILVLVHPLQDWVCCSSFLRLQLRVPTQETRVKKLKHLIAEGKVPFRDNQIWF